MHHQLSSHGLLKVTVEFHESLPVTDNSFTSAHNYGIKPSFSVPRPGHLHNSNIKSESVKHRMLNHTNQDFVFNAFMVSAAEPKHVGTNNRLDEAGHGRPSVGPRMESLTHPKYLHICLL